MVGTEIWVHTYTSQASGLFCSDAATDRTCGMVTFEHAGLWGGTAPFLIDGLIWAASAQGNLYCMEPSSRRPCGDSTTPTVDLDAGRWPAAGTSGVVFARSGRDDQDMDAVSYGTRLYMSTHDTVACYDTATRAACSGWEKPRSEWGNLVKAFSKSGQPNGVCVAAGNLTCFRDANPGQPEQVTANWPWDEPTSMFTMDVEGRSPCSGTGVRMATLDLRDQRCDGTVGAATWDKVVVREADLTPGKDYANFTVIVRDGTTNEVLMSQDMVGGNGTLDLSGISTTSHPSVVLDASTVAISGSPATLAEGTRAILTLSWKADPAPVCARIRATAERCVAGAENLGIRATVGQLSTLVRTGVPRGESCDAPPATVDSTPQHGVDTQGTGVLEPQTLPTMAVETPSTAPRSAAPSLPRTGTSGSELLLFPVIFLIATGAGFAARVRRRGDA